MAESPINDTREFHFTAQDFERIRKLIYDRAGISLSPVKQDMVYSRLARRLRATRIPSFNEYLIRLERGDDVEMEAFTNSLTTNLTSFFREQHHFPLLAEHVKKMGRHHPISLWCSAASTGEEPYSMAMTMVDLFGTFTPPVHILATDLDTTVLQKAQKGIYPLDRLEKMPAETVKKFFLKGAGIQEGQAQVRKELRDMITFRKINLLDESWPMRGPFDAIFCRNVMIYFDKKTQYDVLKKFVPLLHKDGLMFAGHSESFYHAADLFKSLGKTVYELSPQAKLLAAPMTNRRETP
ncbi:CheR-type MCP methyltransferase [Sulfuricella denitrificans skB26]|uniref:Chemotaxis protein methyltransferase n=1 Tax=Sulfuricella denitrificans (strain DSM 22764 / NBRC 105220 / skB26) TaxID=1163617 RepID=S6AG54_SULDS|nr:CheR family methyltransferase [Sulfuricella denitrificans]BAN34956.1 CheR-type MCP methyltransferase [Sulfuricella denitrificans skB26]